jgi:hypothetical protein
MQRDGAIPLTPADKTALIRICVGIHRLLAARGVQTVAASLAANHETTSVMRCYESRLPVTREMGMVVTRDVVAYREGDPPLTPAEGWALTRQYTLVHAILGLTSADSPLAALTRAAGAYTAPPVLMAAVVRAWRAHVADE